MTRINVIPVQELHGTHLVAEYKEIVRVFALARNCQYELHKKKIPNEYTLGSGHVLFFYDKLKYITNRYDLLCTEMLARGYTCNRVPKHELEQKIDRSLFWSYKPTDIAIKLNRDRINLRLAESKAKKLLKEKQKQK